MPSPVADRPAHAALAALETRPSTGAAVGRVLDRVLDEVHEHLAQLLLVGGDRRQPRRRVERRA